MVPSVREADTSCGAPGAATEGIPVIDEATVIPSEFTAPTLTLYVTPFVRPVSTQLVVVDAHDATSVTPATAATMYESAPVAASQETASD